MFEALLKGRRLEMNLGGAPSHAMQYRSHTVNLALKARASSTQFQPFINTSQHMCFENKHHRSDNFHQLQDNQYRKYKYFPRSAQMHGKCTEEHTLPFSSEAAKALKTYWQNRCGTLLCIPISSPIFFAIELSSVGAVGSSTPTLVLRQRVEQLHITEWNSGNFLHHIHNHTTSLPL